MKMKRNGEKSEKERESERDRANNFIVDLHFERLIFFLVGAEQELIVPHDKSIADEMQCWRHPIATTPSCHDNEHAKNAI